MFKFFRRKPVVAADDIPVVDIHSLLKTLTYKPGWRFGVEGIELDINKAHIYALSNYVPSSESKLEQRVQIVNQDSVFLDQGEDYVKRRIWEMLCDSEEHEVKEWLKFEGVRYVEPHPKEDK